MSYEEFPYLLKEIADNLLKAADSIDQLMQHIDYNHEELIKALDRLRASLPPSF